MIESQFLAAKHPPPIIASEIGFDVEIELAIADPHGYRRARRLRLVHIRRGI